MWTHAPSLLEIPKRQRHDAAQRGTEPPLLKMFPRGDNQMPPLPAIPPMAARYFGEGEHRSRWQAEQRSGAKVGSSRSEATQGDCGGVRNRQAKDSPKRSGGCVAQPDRPSIGRSCPWALVGGQAEVDRKSTRLNS